LLDASHSRLAVLGLADHLRAWNLGNLLGEHAPGDRLVIND